MKTVLILTRCVFNEKDFEQKLLRLNCEVFSSSNFMPSLHRDRVSDNDYSIISYFDYLVFSETLTDNEVIYSIPILSKYSTTLLRKTKNYASVNYRECLAIDSDSSIEDLREILSLDRSRDRKVQVSELDRTQLIERLNLSNFERRVLIHLIKNENQIVTREELSFLIWGKKPTNSNLSSLSNMITRIRTKLMKYYDDDHNLQTFWGKGYSWRKDS